MYTQSTNNALVPASFEKGRDRERRERERERRKREARKVGRPNEDTKSEERRTKMGRERETSAHPLALLLPINGDD